MPEVKKIVARLQAVVKTPCPHCGGAIEIELEGLTNFSPGGIEDKEKKG